MVCDPVIHMSMPFCASARDGLDPHSGFVCVPYFGARNGQSIDVVLVVNVGSLHDVTDINSAVAEDGYLPRSFAIRGRRLVYTGGICVLAILSSALLIAFGGVTDRLIPLFVVGAFLAFTLSQSGMVTHWRRSEERGALGSILVNGFGATATAGTVVVVTLVKFMAGAWVVVFWSRH
jgi:hypothetical protein